MKIIGILKIFQQKLCTSDFLNIPFYYNLSSFFSFISNIFNSKNGLAVS